MGQTVYKNNIASVTRAIDEKVICMGRDLLYYSRFGIGKPISNCWKQMELRLLKEAMCMPTCKEEQDVVEAIIKRI